MSETKNIYQRINEAKHSIEGFVKDKTGYQYNYVSGSQVLHKLNPELYKHGINITFKTSDAKYESVNVIVKGKEKNEYIVSLNVHYTITNTDKHDEKIESTIFAIGQQDDPSKALGTALTYSERYFLMKFFGLPTDEDDADAKEKQDKYAKVDPKNVEELEKEIENFRELMKSVGTNVSANQVNEELGITNINNLTNKQISEHIFTLNEWSKDTKTKEND